MICTLLRHFPKKVHTKGSFGNTALHIASGAWTWRYQLEGPRPFAPPNSEEEPSADAIRTLVRMGASVDALAHGGFSTFAFALKYGNWEAATVLFCDMGVHPGGFDVTNFPHTGAGMTPPAGTEEKRAALLKGMVESGFDINATSDCEDCCCGSPLAGAIQRRDFSTATAMLELDADREIASERVRRTESMTLVSLAKKSFWWSRIGTEAMIKWRQARNDIIRRLVAMGGPLEASVSSNVIVQGTVDTCLTLCFRQVRKETEDEDLGLLSLLLEPGAEPNKKDSFGRTPLNAHLHAITKPGGCLEAALIRGEAWSPTRAKFSAMRTLLEHIASLDLTDKRELLRLVMPEMFWKKKA
ncbi:hypothetical protein B0T14DRAFT_199263 [Immersiella caudata]|uniref:Uncharacterized protein n=1 Tax=Immersiella caudata TaxID=314043 RepID=A0AA39WP78_9PEZI|nr:hypothetical protein B0T14DRAFT_199263 [Immersiella caudata]